MDLVGATFIRFVSNQVCNVFRYPCGCIVAVGMSLCIRVSGQNRALGVW